MDANQILVLGASVLAAAGIRISMDGRSRWMDNVFIERLWRSLKYEDIYLKGYADGCEARAGIEFQRPHRHYKTARPWSSGKLTSMAKSARRLWI